MLYLILLEYYEALKDWYYRRVKHLSKKLKWPALYVIFSRLSATSKSSASRAGK